MAETKARTKSGLHRGLLEELEKRGGEKHKFNMGIQRYIGTNKPCYSLSASSRKEILRKWFLDHRNLTFGEYRDLLLSLAQGESHEEVSLVGALLGAFPKFRRLLEPEILHNFLEGTEGWAEVDSIAQSNFTAREILGDWERWKKVILELSENSNVHKRRASLVILTLPVREVRDERLADLAFQLIEKLKGEKDILITKAVSWLLRDMIKNFREEVEGYLEERRNTLPAIARRKVKRKLETGRK